MVPLQKQLYRQIANAIRDESIASQARLPATRVMAAILGVSRNTVLAAYDELSAAGFLCGEPGSGMRVNGPNSVGQKSLFGLQHVIRAAGYPARVLLLSDGDGNALYIQY
jgi:DNA-binding GntR family transcriptional regulator